MGPDTISMGFFARCHEGVLSLRRGRIGCIPTGDLVLVSNHLVYGKNVDEEEVFTPYG